MFLTFLRLWVPLYAPEGAGAGAGEGEGQGDGGAGAGAPPNGAAGAGEVAPGESFDMGKWRESLKDPKLKAAAERFNSVEDMLTSNVTLRTEIADRIRLPGPNATPEDLQKFRKSFGVPEDVKGYEVALPEGQQLSETDKMVVDAWKGVAHEHNIPGKTFQALVLKSMELARGIEEQAEKGLKDAQAASEAALKKEWGSEYDKNKQLAFRAGEAFGGLEFKAMLETAEIDGMRLGDHPTMLKLLATIGRRADEADLVVRSSAEEKQTAQARLKELQAAHPVGTPGYKDPAVQAEIKGLFETIYGKKPIVGASGRGS